MLPQGGLCKKKFVALILRDLAEGRLELRVFMRLLCSAWRRTRSSSARCFRRASRTLPSLRPGLTALLNALDEVEP